MAASDAALNTCSDGELKDLQNSDWHSHKFQLYFSFLSFNSYSSGFFSLQVTVASTLFAAALGLRVGFAANRRRCVVVGISFFIFYLYLSFVNLRKSS